MFITYLYITVLHLFAILGAFALFGGILQWRNQHKTTRAIDKQLKELDREQRRKGKKI